MPVSDRLPSLLGVADCERHGEFVS